jgi:hypothetical protein
VSDLPPSMYLRRACDALREVAAGTGKPHLVAYEALREIELSQRKCMGFGPEEAAERRHEQQVECDSLRDEKAAERRAMGWMSAS